MALKQKFTWNDFLKAHPEAKKKSLKRTSAEGKKAFETAYKAFMKEYLKDREIKTKKFIDKVTKTKAALVATLKKTEGKKWHLKTKALNQKIGRHDAAIARFEKLIVQTKEVAKQF